MILSFSWTLHNHLHLLENSQRTFVSIVSGRIELRDISTFKIPYSASTSEYIPTCKTHKTDYISTFKTDTSVTTAKYISTFKTHTHTTEYISTFKNHTSATTDEWTSAFKTHTFNANITQFQ